jgi:hypothetical protein
MPPRDTDDDARKAAKGRVERLSVPGVPGLRLPPRPSPDSEATPPEPYVTKRRERERTRTDWPAVPPVAPRGQPVASTPLPVSSAGDRSAMPPASLIPAPWDDTTENRVAAVKAGYRTAYVPSSPPPLPAYAEPAWWRSAGGVAKVIGAAAGGLVAATASLVAIIGALRQPTDPKLREEVEATRREVAGLRTYLDNKDTARQLELEKRFDALSARLTDLDLRYPAPKPNPLRPPKP